VSGWTGGAQAASTVGVAGSGWIGLDCAASVVEEVHRAASLAATGIRDALF
jgi:hypothetical protein